MALEINPEGGTQNVAFATRDSHSGATIYEVSADGIAPAAYEDTDHYRITRAFLENPQTFLHPLFADD